MPQVETVHQASEAAPLLKTVSECQPALVLLDTSLPGQVPDTIEQIKTEWPQVRCLVLADTEKERQEAQDAGADVAVLNGHPAEMLFQVVQDLVSGGGGSMNDTSPDCVSA
jgi:DNA-binding NarL/FixJ family response regulator